MNKYTEVHRLVCTCVFFSTALHFIFRGRSFTGVEFTNQLYWLVSKALVSSWLLLSWVRITGLHSQVTCFMYWGFSCLHSKYFTL